MSLLFRKEKSTIFWGGGIEYVDIPYRVPRADDFMLEMKGAFLYINFVHIGGFLSLSPINYHDLANNNQMTI